MGFRNRILLRMDGAQRILLFAVLGSSLLLQIVMEYLYLSYYQFKVYHLAMMIGLILLILNPSGIRALFFCLFTYLLIGILSIGSYSHNDLAGTSEMYFFGLPLLFFDVSPKLISFTHIGLYAALAYFSFNNPFPSRKKKDIEVLDRFD